ncbi:TAXI family TRAP transporter solute-binding subunit [Paracoccus laeviglucosivorans]|nr:TAXI family TRAP transporter solute-binding subunit [Paracoccus laeviglucosivorans]
MLRLVLALVMGLGFSAHAQDLRLYTMGSGDVSGNYYAAAAALCDATNRAESGKLRCSPEATPGSIYNLGALRSGQLDFALVQSDVQHMVLKSEGPFEGAPPFPDLRAVMSLYPETLTILARPGAKILSIKGLIGKRVDIGLPASGRRATAMRLLTSLGLDRSDFLGLLELPTGSALDELCAGTIDATILIVGHPNDGVARAIKECDARLVTVSGPEVRAFLEQNPDYVYASIPRAPYGKKGRALSFAVMATLVTRADIPDDIVGAITQHTLENLLLVGLSAPVLNNLAPRAMQETGLTAPLHPAAAQVFNSAVPN